LKLAQSPDNLLKLVNGYLDLLVLLLLLLSRRNCSIERVGHLRVH